MQRAAKAHNQDRIDAEKIDLCGGIGFGKILTIADHDVFGEEVNAACKVGEELAGPGEILVTQSVVSCLGGLSSAQLEKVDPGLPGQDVNRLVYSP